MNQHAVPNAIFAFPGKPINGGSNPRFYEFDDGVTRLVKWHPSGHGTKACYNELVASRLGQLIGSPILRGGVIYVPADIIPPEHKAFGAKAGFHFGVTRMVGTNFVAATHYADIENSSELPFAAVFLAWLAVGDQQGHNQYLQQLEINGVTAKRFKLIDMGFMFGDPNWTDPTVRTVHDSYTLPPHLAAKLSLATLGPAIAAVVGLDESSIRLCFEDCPDEWNIDPKDKQAGTVRACAAKAIIQQIIQKGNSTVV